MSQYDEYYAAIDEIKAFLFRDLIGPIEEEEVLENVEPLQYYAMGMLWPKRLGSSVEGDPEQLNLRDLSLANDIENLENPFQTDDDSIAEANMYKPSAMAVSVMVPARTGSLEVVFSFAKYIVSSVEQPAIEESKPPRTVNYYTRKTCRLLAEFLIPKQRGTFKCEDNSKFRELGVDISLCVRKVMPDGSRLVTVAVSNALEAPQRNKEQNESAMFQCRLHLHLSEGFVPIYQNELWGQSKEEQISAMQYRKILNYAYGHGCSVEYAHNNETNVKITDIYSDFMPSERVIQIMPGAITESAPLKLIYWRTADRHDACQRLLALIDEYATWAALQRSSAEALDNFRVAAEAVMELIDTCIFRLKRGVEMLRSNDDAWSAFKLMNEAMLLQRAKSKGLKDDQLENVKWYPFQLAYILQILPDITEANSAFRDTVDLLWFPTGGGKTEAYFGVAAFVIFYRRLSTQPTSDGVTIIMRYTLRLLTIQQFERASALICACEYLRRKHDISGGEVSIGLWIGSAMTPNHIGGPGGAEEILKALKENPDKKVLEGNPVQVTTCPWCASPIDLDGYAINESHELGIRCHNNPRCEFHQALPIYVVDDNIYRMRPTLVLSTIDKFARLAWEIDSKSLFGGDGIVAPELIIQDELHLISGPLGSLAGVYEIGVEYLCGCNGRYPKVIASTATVKNAAEQILNLYNKKMFQFPPSGIDFGDSFFAVKASEKERPARTYIGLCEMGGTLADLMIRVYANLMFVKALFIKQRRPTGVIDQFSTIVGYFNAIRDLGSTDNIISDRIYAYVRTLVNLKFKADSQKAELTLQEIRTGQHEELTSRKTSKEIKETLECLDLSYDKVGSLSYVLASNMLSVGIDIDRLGVMTVYNQPKTNAEYIQATSRVGRRNPGLLLVMYNGARSRDKSHYEQFGFYHRSFYQYVEATSVTPFSARAIEKAVHCVFTIMLRLSEPSLGANELAVCFRAKEKYAEDARKFILDRIARIRPESVDDAQQWLENVAVCWEELARENPDTLVYKTTQGGYCSLLFSGEQGSSINFPATLNSLRNVEPSANVFIQERD